MKELIREHNANKCGLQESRFEVTDLMVFWGEHTTLACNWVRHRDLLKHYHEHTPVPRAWQTVIDTTACDDPLSQPGTFAGLSRSDDQDDEGKQEDNPESPRIHVPKRSSSRRRFSNFSSTPTGPKNTPEQSFHKAPADLQLRPAERVADASSYLPEGTSSVWSVEKARGLLPKPVVWDDLRLDVQR